MQANNADIGDSAGGEELPVIRTTGRHAREIIDEAAEALWTANDHNPQLFASGRNIYRKKSGGYFLMLYPDLRTVLGRSVNFVRDVDGIERPLWSIPDGHISMLRVHLLDNLQRFPRVPAGVVIGESPQEPAGGEGGHA